MTYSESMKILDKVRRRDEMLFRMSISHLMDVGMRNLDDESVEKTCEAILKEDDSKSFMTNGYKCAIVRTASELAKVDHIHLLVYIQREIDYDVGENYEEENEDDIV